MYKYLVSWYDDSWHDEIWVGNSVYEIVIMLGNLGIEPRKIQKMGLKWNR